MRLLITDVTEMHAGNYCVAGWCTDENRMVRPLPNGANWSAPLLNTHGVIPGATLHVQPTGAMPNSAYPHRTEDTWIDATHIGLVSLGPVPWFGPDAPPTAPTLSDAFQGQIAYNRSWDGVRKGVHVPLACEVRSLWAVSIDRDRLRFVEDFKKLRAILDDSTVGSVPIRLNPGGRETVPHDAPSEILRKVKERLNRPGKWQLAVSSKHLNEIWRSQGLSAVNDALPASGPLHVRLGLARKFEDQPNKCFVMINGVFW